MRLRHQFGWAFCIVMSSLASSSFAQQPAPDGGPPNMPPMLPNTLPSVPPLSPPYGMPVTLAQAKAMAATIQSEAVKNKIDGSIVIAVVNPSGEMIYFEKGDNSTNWSITIAEMKARVAARHRTPTGFFSGPGGGAIPPLPDSLVLPGGFPIVYEGKTIGGIGVSGAERGLDSRLAQAALDALNKK